MAATKQIERDRWETYFDDFVKRHVEHEPPKAATIEIMSLAMGDQLEAASHLSGITYDPKSNALEVLLEDMDHLVFYPSEIWVLEEEDGFIDALEVIAPDGTKEIVHIQRSGVPAPIYPAP